MTDLNTLGQAFLTALASRDAAAYESVLSESAGMRILRWDRVEAHRPRERVARRLVEEWSAWSDPHLEPLNTVASGDCIALEFRIHAVEDGRFVSHNRSAFLKLREGLVDTIDMYCTEPIPSAPRKGWIAPKDMTREELGRLLDSLFYAFDIREWIPPNRTGQLSARFAMGSSGDSHPGSNSVVAVHWTPKEADARIEELIARYRAMSAGFSWLVSPSDTPADLGERLERHGFVLAGDEVVMARVGLDDLDDIAENPELTIETLDGTDDDAIEASIRTTAISFKWTPEQTAQRRDWTFERMHDPRTYETEMFFLARLNGVPVGDAHLEFKSGLAYLGGACTLPEYRRQRVYSTLLRHRLEVARDRGYHISAIHAGPMSRPVVSRYGFKEYSRAHLYGWMPVIDRNVIKSLIPDD